MNFRPELATQVMAGEKTVTRRLMSDNPRSPWFKGGCKLREGRDYAVCPGRGKPAIGRVRVLDVTGLPLGHVDPLDARLEGFADVAEFEAAFAGINGRYDPDAWVWRVAFAVSTVNGGSE